MPKASADYFEGWELRNCNSHPPHLCFWLIVPTYNHIQRRTDQEQGWPTKPSWSIMSCQKNCWHAADFSSLQCSEKGYMNGVIGKEWISQDFDPATCEIAGNCFWLLVVDGHCSPSPMTSLNMQKVTKLRFCAYLPIPLIFCKVCMLVGWASFLFDTFNSLGCTWVLSIQDSLPEACQQHGLWMWGHFDHSDFLKAIEGPYNQAFSAKHILKAFELTGCWPVNWDKIGPDKTATSIQ